MTNKAKKLSIVLFVIYIICSIVYSIIRVKFIDGDEISQFKIFRSSFVQLAPSLLFCAYMVWKTNRSVKQ